MVFRWRELTQSKVISIWLSIMARRELKYLRWLPKVMALQRGGEGDLSVDGCLNGWRNKTFWAQREDHTSRSPCYPRIWQYVQRFKCMCNPISGPCILQSLVNSSIINCCPMKWRNIAHILPKMRCPKVSSDISNSNFSMHSFEGQQRSFTQYHTPIAYQTGLSLYRVQKSNLLWWSWLTWCCEISTGGVLATDQRSLMVTGWVWSWENWSRNYQGPSQMCSEIGLVCTWWMHMSGQWWK